MLFICFAIGVVNVLSKNVVSFDDATKPTRLVIKDGKKKGCELRLVIPQGKKDEGARAEKMATAVDETFDPCLNGAVEQHGRFVPILTTRSASGSSLVCQQETRDVTARQTDAERKTIGEFVYTTPPDYLDSRCKSMAFIAIELGLLERAAVVSEQTVDPPATSVISAPGGITVVKEDGSIRLTSGGCTIALPLDSVLDTESLDVAALKTALDARKDIHTCLTGSSPRMRGRAFKATKSSKSKTSDETWECRESEGGRKLIGEYSFPTSSFIKDDTYAGRCQSVAYIADVVTKLAAKQSPISEDEQRDAVPPTAPQPAFSRSPTIVQESSTLSMIGTQEDIFFTNFHNAAQQLSLLGIKAVGLATQIQAIRGHMMMLKLIDEHIAQLGEDNDKYTKLLNEALGQLEIVTEMPARKPDA